MTIENMGQLQGLVREHGLDDDYDWKQHGEVRAIRNDDHSLLMFSYNQKAMYDGRWSWFERVSRGLIMDAATGEVVARPFDKFFNLGEGGREYDDCGPIVDVADKLDGSLGIHYRHDGRHKIATKGSFSSTQAEWATEKLKGFALDGMNPDLTLLFEIIYPRNRVVVDYGAWESLTLIGMRNRRTGEEWGVGQVIGFASVVGFGLPSRGTSTLKDLVQAAETLPVSREGWVVRFANGERCKIKGEEYRRIHRIISLLNPKHIAEQVLAGGLQSLLESVPDYLHDEIRGHARTTAKLIGHYERVIERAHKAAPKTSRKDYAIWCREMHPLVFHCLMPLFTGDDYSKQLAHLVLADVSRETESTNG